MSQFIRQIVANLCNVPMAKRRQSDMPLSTNPGDVYKSDRQDQEKPLRILIVNWRSPLSRYAGGAETHLEEIGSLLVKVGVSVTILSGGEQELGRDGRVSGMVNYRIGGDVSFLWRYRTGLRRVLAKGNFDLVVDDISKLPMGIHQRVDVPTIAWCHHIHGAMLYKELPWLMAWCADRIERRIGRTYRDVPMLAVSESTRQELIAMGLNSFQVGLVPNGVAATTISRIQEKRSPEPLLLYLGRLQRYKNVDCVIRAMVHVRQSIPNARLVVLGTGKDESRLRHLAQQVCPGAVEFRGYVTESQKHMMLHQAWLAVATSMKEGWGICILEANAAGTPVVASNVPGHRDAIRHDQTGWLYPFDDDATMARIIVQGLTQNDLRLRVGIHARRWAESFTWKNSVHTFLEWARSFYPQLAVKIDPVMKRLAGRSPICGDLQDNKIPNRYNNLQEIQISSHESQVSEEFVNSRL